jgi:predicted alpha/beta hydrolase family esterase
MCVVSLNVNNTPNTILILHGSFAEISDNWFQWLFQSLNVRKSYTVLLPQFPYGAEQSYNKWSAVLDGIPLDENTTVFAHSVAPIFICKYLNEHKKKIKKLISVSGFNGKIGNAQYDEVNATFLLDKINPKVADEIVCIYGDNDPYVPFEMLDSFAESLKAQKIIIKNGGHLNAESGFTEFPQLLNYL